MNIIERYYTDKDSLGFKYENCKSENKLIFISRNFPAHFRSRVPLNISRFGSARRLPIMQLKSLCIESAVRHEAHGHRSGRCIWNAWLEMGVSPITLTRRVKHHNQAKTPAADYR